VIVEKQFFVLWKVFRISIELEKDSLVGVSGDRIYLVFGLGGLKYQLEGTSLNTINIYGTVYVDVADKLKWRVLNLKMDTYSLVGAGKRRRKRQEIGT
jgi:hypothetical protein